VDDDHEDEPHDPPGSIVIFGNLYSSKNSKEIRFNRVSGKRFVGNNSNVLKQKKDILWQLKGNALKQKWKMLTKNKSYPLRLRFTIYRKSKQRFDYVNIIQILLDCMVDARFIADDNADVVIPSFAPYRIDRENPRTIVEVLHGDI